MVTSCGLSCYHIAFYHLINHAFFKSLLFLGAGCIISSLFDEQDVRRYGNLVYKLPLVYICTLIGILALAGFPFLTGFYSKDLVIESFYSRYVVDSFFLYFLGVFTAFLTAIYSSRLVFFVFFFFSNYSDGVNKKLKSVYISINMLIPLVLLSFSSIFVGYLINDLFFGLGSNFLMNIIYINPKNYTYLDMIVIGPLLSNLPLIVTVLAFILGYKISLKICQNRIFSMYIYMVNKYLSIFFCKGGFFNYIYNYIFIECYKYSYNIHTKIIDKGFLEEIGPYGIYKYCRKLSFNNLIKRNYSIFFNMYVCMYVFFFFLSGW